MDAPYVLEIDPDPRLVPTARMFAATLARQMGCEEDAVLDAKIAVSEACTNAVQAHRGGKEMTPITLSVGQEGAALVYEIRDEGRSVGNEPGEPPTVFRQAVEEEVDPQDMGLALIKAIFPRAEFITEEHGALVRFRLGD